MKKKTKLNLRAALSTFGFAIALLYGFSASAGINPVEEDKPAKNKFRIKSFNSLNNNSVRIYPDVIKRDMHVVAKENKKEIDFFVFDIEGTLLHHYKMKDKDHYKISGLARGTYIYRVFSGDMETAAGDFQIR